MSDSIALAAPGHPGALPPAPESGLIGRSPQVAELRALLAEDRVAPLWLTGYEGTGKTALIGEVARILAREGRYERVVYTSLGRSGVPESALYDLGQCLIGPDYRLSEGALETIEEAITRVPTLIIWDDAGPILYGGSLALDQQSLISWYQMANRIAARNASALCVLSDTIDLPPSARRLAGVREFKVATMDDAAALELGQRLDEVAGVEHNPAVWQRLIQWLGGHPGALTCLSAARPNHSMDGVAADLSAQAPGLPGGEGRFRNRAFDLALDYLVGSLPEPLHDHIAELGLCVGGFVQNLGPEIMGLSREVWLEQSVSLVRAGLMWDEPAPVLTIPVVRFHAALQRWTNLHLTGERREAATTAHYSHYFGFLSWIVKSAANLRDQGPRLFYREIGNVRMGLTSILAAGEVQVAVSYIQLYNALLKELGFERESTRATDQVALATQALLPQEGAWTQAGVELALGQAEAFIASGDLQKAGSLLSQLAVRFEKPDGVDYKGRDATLHHVRVLVNLARVLRNTQHVDIAARSLNEAVDLLDPFDADAATRIQRAEIFRDIVEVQLQLNQFDDAADACRRGLSALGDLDQPQLKSTLHARAAQLAVRQNDLDSARYELGQAAAIMEAAGDLQGLTAVENQLAGIALQTPNGLPEAMDHLERAIGFARQGGQWLIEAQLHSQKAQLLSQQNKPEDSELELRQTVALYETNGATGLLTMALASLAEFLLHRRRPDEAQAEADRALAAGHASGQSLPWELYLLLQRIASARQDGEAVSRWREMTQKTFSQSSEAANMLKRWSPLLEALERAAHGEALDTDAARALESMENTPRADLAHSLWLVLSGERGSNVYAPLDHIGATIVQALVDRIDRPASAQEPDATE